MPRKTYNEKLRSPGELPKIEDLSAKRWFVRGFEYAMWNITTGE